MLLQCLQACKFPALFSSSLKKKNKVVFHFQCPMRNVNERCFVRSQAHLLSGSDSVSHLFLLL